jgi:hypothetical protein
MSKKLPIIKKSQYRSREANVRQIRHNMFVVDSLTNDLQSYLVIVRRHSTLEGMQIRVKCECDFQAYGGEGCVHALAVIRHIALAKGYAYVGFWDNLSDAERQKHHLVQIGESLWATAIKVSNK